MTYAISLYLPQDRRDALVKGLSLPTRAEGAALFADISGFTRLTEQFTQQFGLRHGIEMLTEQINAVYDALISVVDSYEGSVISFAGDAITCWFGGGNAAARTVACAQQMQTAMHSFEGLALKVAVSSGTAWRWVVGDPAVQLIDTLAGAMVARLAAGEHLASQGEILLDTSTVKALGTALTLVEWRTTDTGERFAVLAALTLSIQPTSVSLLATDIPAETLRAWLLPAVFAREAGGYGTFLTELRPTAALFVNFAGIDYDADPTAGEKLDQFVRLVQRIISGQGGNVIQLTIGDKGSYFYAAFGAPTAYEDNTLRALNAAFELCDSPEVRALVPTLSIGISQGTMRTGAYGSETRRTYGVLGDEVNLAARLMQAAEPDAILISSAAYRTLASAITADALPPMQFKGKAQPETVYRMTGRKDRTFERSFFSTSLVGREDELLVLIGHAQPLFSGQHAGIITLQGEPGIGKSHLAYALQQQLEARGVRWFTGQMDELQHTPLQAFIYFLRAVFNQRRDRSSSENLHQFNMLLDDLIARTSDEVLRRDLQIYRSFIAGIMGIATPGSLFVQADAKLRIDNAIAGIKAWVRAECQRHPVVIHIEDIHWMDESSFAAIRNLTYNMDRVPLLLLLTSRNRDDGSPVMLDNVGDVPQYRLEVTHLTDVHTRQMIEQVLNAPVAPGVVRLVREKAEGNPFFTEQLALDLRERNLLTPTEGRLELDANAATEVPMEVNAVLIARLDRLAGQVKAVVQTASVLGREFDVMVLSRMLRAEEFPYVNEAEREAIWSAVSELRYIFRHALLRDAAYQMQVQARLQDLHRAAAGAIEALYPEDDKQQAVLMDHWYAAGEMARSLRYAVAIIPELLDGGDLNRAIHLIERGLASGEHGYRAKLLQLRGNIATTQYQLEAAFDFYQQCLTETNLDDDLLVSVYQGLADASFRNADYAGGMAYAQTSLDMARILNQPRQIAVSLAYVALLHTAQGNTNLADELYLESARICREIDYKSFLHSVLHALGVSAAQRGDVKTARTYFNEVLAIRREFGNLAEIASALRNLGTLATFEDDYTTADQYYTESLALLVEVGDQHASSRSLGRLGESAISQGRYAAGKDYLQRSLSLSQTLNDQVDIGMTLRSLGWVAQYEGDFGAAEDYYRQSIDILRDIGARSWLVSPISWLGQLRLTRADYATARELYEQEISYLREMEDWQALHFFLVNLVRADIEQGDLNSAQARMDEVLALQSQISGRNEVAFACYTRGYLAYAKGDYSTSQQYYEESLSIYQKINHYQGVSVSLNALGVVAHVQGKNDVAQTYYTDSLKTSQRVGGRFEIAETQANLALLTLQTGQFNAILAELLTSEQARYAGWRLAHTLLVAAYVLFTRHAYENAAAVAAYNQSLGHLEKHYQPFLSALQSQIQNALEPAAYHAAAHKGRSMDVDAVLKQVLPDSG